MSVNVVGESETRGAAGVETTGIGTGRPSCVVSLKGALLSNTRQ